MDSSNCHLHASPQHRIALVVCYFGRLPNYAPLVMRSAASNPTIDWLIFGDHPPDFMLPNNVRYLPLTMRELEKKMESACETPVCIDHPIDLTRLKPTYGLCFAELLKDYDFWGHVDLDMIYGDLRKFMRAEVLNTHTRIYCRGHLSLFKNDPEVNRLFMLSAPGAPEYKKILANKDRTQFDEWAGIWKIFRYHRIPQYHAEVIADIKPPSLYWIRRFEAEELQNYAQQVFYWHDGKTFQLYYHREGGLFDQEVAYVHFQKRKFPKPSHDIEASAGFLIGPEGFTPYDRENLTSEEMEKYNATRRRNWQEVMELQLQRIKRKISKKRK